MAHLILFLKAPQLGNVKTRLAQSIGPEKALQAYQKIVGKLLKNLSGWPSLELRFTPDDQEDLILPWKGPGWTVAPQGSGSLGQRLHQAAAEAFDQGHEKILLIGSDCPWILAGDLRQASQALDSHDLILGPAMDGGYWLLGLSQLYSELFQHIPWSTPGVLPATLKQARQLHLKTCLLHYLRDIDTLSDWNAFQRST